MLKDFASFLVLVLMILGVGGAMFHAIGPDGWIVQAFAGLMRFNLGSALGIVVALGVAIWLGRRWLDDRQSNKLFNDGVVYFFAALGLFFAGRLLLIGSV